MSSKAKNKRGFTLIELLVVIAIIALLMAVVVPSLRRAKEYAKKILDKNNMHQVGVALANYEALYKFNFRENNKWYFDSGTGDMPWEPGTATVPDQTRMFRDIIRADMIPNHEVFFCPGVANVSYDKNYLRSAVLLGNTTTYAMADMEQKIINRDPSFVGQYPALWSTYAFLWKKRPATPSGETPSSGARSINSASSGVLFTDITMRTWGYALKLNNQDAQIMVNLKNAGHMVKQTFPHFLALMKDYSVANPTDKDTKENPEATQWLWNSTTWGGLGIDSDY